MAQVLNYHRYGAAVFDSFDSYTSYSGVDIDMDSERYDFPSFSELNELLAALQVKYNEQSTLDDSDAALLGVACGFAAKMDYTSEGSGASVADAQSAMVNKFGLYSADIVDGLSSQSIRVVRENIINGLPVLLGIRSGDGRSGHLIVCDGYNTAGDYHLNFGWTSSRPAPITEAWYRLPSGIPTYLCAIDAVIVNICPTQPSICVTPDALDFVSKADESGQTKTFAISSAIGPVHVSSIVCPAGFTAAVGDSNDYSAQVGPFDIEERDQEWVVHVKFNPPASGGYYGTLAINYDNGQIRYLILQGDAHAGGTEVAAGSVSGTWSAAESPYYVLGDIEVGTGEELTIEPGVQVIFTGRYSLTVGQDAKLTAQGGATKPIEFTASNTELGFGGLRLVETGDDDILSFCHITYARKGVGEIGTEYGIRDLNGGALYLYDCSPTITHCVLANNFGDSGGAICCNSSSPIISNTVIANNACAGGIPQAGGICFVGDSEARIDSCTIVNNSPGGIYSEATYDTELSNTIVWGNLDFQIVSSESVVAASACDVQGGWSGESNINVDPAFFDPTPGIGLDYDGAAANWSLKSTSPCINAGKAEINADVDLAGNTRVYSDIIDIGAHESQSDLALMTVTPAGQVDAGCVAVNTIQSATLDITNTGKRQFTITKVELTDANGLFSVAGSLTGKVVTAGESARVEIRFAPTAEKASNATLHIYSTADNASDKQVQVRGVGITGTSVSGSVSGTWTKAKSPYTVTGDLSIPKSKTLTIEPGVVVRFAGAYSLTVGYRATLKAVGTESLPILFTATDTSKGWKGIRFINTSTDDALTYCTIEYAKKPYSQTNDWRDMYGGGILCCEDSDPASGTETVSSPKIDRCVIRDCYADYGGAVCFMDYSLATLSNSVITNNATAVYGGGVFCYLSFPKITNNVIADNDGYVGGGVSCFYASPTVSCNTIVGNHGAGIYLDSSTYLLGGSQGTITNNIVWENEMFVESTVLSVEYKIRYNDVQGGLTGTGNVDTDPLFADAAHGDYHLKSEAGRWNPSTGAWVTDSVTSPCIDAGDPSMSVGSESSPNGGRINMGAYAGTAQASKSK
jgi:hypothetical protein